jgi:hypothetical protein
MKTSIIYNSSKLCSGEMEFIRQHSFTRWMSSDLLQASTDFCKNIGFHALYVETSTDGTSRYLFWRPLERGGSEIRSNRTKNQFEEFDKKNNERGWILLSLHINECDIYSAVWVSNDRFDSAVKLLRSYGISPAERNEKS